MTQNIKEMTTLVVGGTGKTGRRVAQQLQARDIPVRIGSRSSETPFDWNDRSTWKAALDGVTAAYVTYYPDLAFPGAAEAIKAFADLAVAGGTTKLVLLSGRGEAEAWPAEQAVQDSGAQWTILRPAWFAQNFSEHFLLEPVLEGVIALPAGNIAEPFIDVDDIAEVAVAALTEPGHEGKIYELTGPRLLTFHDVAADLTGAIGREVSYLPVTAEEYKEAALAAGVPAEEVDPLTDLFTRVLDGRNAHVTDGVQQALGRPASDFLDYARAAATTGVWAAR